MKIYREHAFSRVYIAEHQGLKYHGSSFYNALANALRHTLAERYLSEEAEAHARYQYTHA